MPIPTSSSPTSVLAHARTAALTRIGRSPSTAWALALLGAAAACGPSGSDAGAPEADPGRLVIVGGGLQRENAAVYRAVLDGVQGEGPFCIVPTASGVPEESIASALESFTLHGADSLDALPITTDHPEAASDPEVVRRIRACSGFWFVGGVQSRVVEVFLPGGAATPAYEAVMERFREGAVVAGSSAGAAIMPPRMIAGGTSAGAFEHGIVEGPLADDDESEGVIIERGMGFDDGPLYDQHFLARGRIGRLWVATLGGIGGGVGFGIDENTALVVDGATGTVVGASGVVLVDARSATRTPDGGGTGILVHLMGAGDTVDMDAYTVRLGNAKAPLASGAEAAVVPEDPFARWAFLQFMESFGRAGGGTVTMTAAGHRITVESAEGFGAFGLEGEGVQGTRAGLSVGPFLVSLAPGE